MKEGKWRLGDKEAKSLSLAHRTVGLLGYGHVNQNVHRLLMPFGCAVKILKRKPAKDQFGPEDLNTFLKQVDTLVIALPLTEQTKNMISAEQLALLGKDGILINAGRGEIVVEKDLFDALKNKTISDAAIDVWYNYNPEPDEAGRKFPYQYPFYELNNILLSPHRAASPFDDLGRWDDVIENINRLGRGEIGLLNVVNLEDEY